MSKFSKYIKDGEVLRLTIALKSQSYKINTVFITIFVAFFLIYPVFQAGRQAMFLWMFTVTFLLFALARLWLSANHRYLLTDKRIIFIQAINNRYSIRKGTLEYRRIKSIRRIGRNSIKLHIKYRDYYLHNLNDRDKVYSSIVELCKANVTKKD